jgi:hypothetical protein
MSRKQLAVSAVRILLDIAHMMSRQSCNRYLLVSSLAAVATACGGVGTEGTVHRTANAGITAAATPGACTSATLDGGWITGDLGQRSGTFTVEVDATPSTSSDDALFGLSHGAASHYTDLAAIARFSPAGIIDARNGGAYGADFGGYYGAYQGGVMRRLRFDVNTVTHTYSVRDVYASGASPIATNFAFRTEQAKTSILDHYALKVDAGGPLGVCNVTVIEPGQCGVAVPSGGFVNRAFPSQAVAFTASFTATPAAAGIDGVVGLSATPAGAFDDLAAAIRFNPGGTIDVRSGRIYTADKTVAYVAGQAYAFQLIVDVVGSSYSVFVDGTPLARNYAFRPQQLNVSSLANLALIADSTTGPVTACDFATASPSPQAVYMHDMTRYGVTSIRPVPSGNQLLVAGGPNRTLTLDERGNQVAEAPFGGSIAIDGAGDVYLVGQFTGTYDAGGGPLVSAGGSDVYVSKYDSSWHYLWSRSFGGPGDDVASMPDVNAEGDLVMVVGGNALLLNASGSVVSTIALPAGAIVAVDPAGNPVIFDVGPSAAGGTSITKLDGSAAPIWSRSVDIVQGSGGVMFVRADGAGDVVFTGYLDGTVDFGGMQQLTVRTGGDGGHVTFLAKFDTNGALVYVTSDFINFPRDLELDRAGNATIGGPGTNNNQFHVLRVDPAGRPLFQSSGLTHVTPLDLLGQGDPELPVADLAGNTYWSIHLWDRALDYFVKLRP